MDKGGGPRETTTTEEGSTDRGATIEPTASYTDAEEEENETPDSMMNRKRQVSSTGYTSARFASNVGWQHSTAADRWPADTTSSASRRAKTYSGLGLSMEANGNGGSPSPPLPFYHQPSSPSNNRHSNADYENFIARRNVDAFLAPLYQVRAAHSPRGSSRILVDSTYLKRPGGGGNYDDKDFFFLDSERSVAETARRTWASRSFSAGTNGYNRPPSSSLSSSQQHHPSLSSSSEQQQPTAQRASVASSSSNPIPSTPDQQKISNTGKGSTDGHGNDSSSSLGRGKMTGKRTGSGSVKGLIEQFELRATLAKEESASSSPKSSGDKSTPGTPTAAIHQPRRFSRVPSGLSSEMTSPPTSTAPSTSAATALATEAGTNNVVAASENEEDGGRRGRSARPQTLSRAEMAAAKKGRHDSVPPAVLAKAAGQEAARRAREKGADLTLPRASEPQSSSAATSGGVGGLAGGEAIEEAALLNVILKMRAERAREEEEEEEEERE